MKPPGHGVQEIPCFPREGLAFLRQLHRNNNRDWFQARKESYHRWVRDPMAELVRAVGETLRNVAPEIVADPKVSMYRIYRDTRFSRDKTPYKTQAAAVFPVRGLPKNSGPGLYFHISPKEVLIGGGMYMPDTALLRAVRQHIAAHPKKFTAIVEGGEFRRAFGELEGERLKTVPKGFHAGNPAARYLRFKQYLFGEIHPVALGTSPRLLPTIVKAFQKGFPLIRFLAVPARRVGPSLVVARTPPSKRLQP